MKDFKKDDNKIELLLCKTPNDLKLAIEYLIKLGYKRQNGKELSFDKDQLPPFIKSNPIGITIKNKKVNIFNWISLKGYDNLCREEKECPIISLFDLKKRVMKNIQKCDKEDKEFAILIKEKEELKDILILLKKKGFMWKDGKDIFPEVNLKDVTVSFKKYGCGILLIFDKYDHLTWAYSSIDIDNIEKNQYNLVDKDYINSLPDDDFIEKAEILINEEKLTNNNNKMEKKNIFKSMIEKIKKQYVPEKDENLGMTIDGSIAVRKSSGSYISIDSNNELVEYPEEMIIKEIPVFFSFLRRFLK